jgi:hypothetical protein
LAFENTNFGAVRALARVGLPLGISLGWVLLFLASDRYTAIVATSLNKTLRLARPLAQAKAVLDASFLGVEATLKDTRRLGFTSIKAAGF